MRTVDVGHAKIGVAETFEEIDVGAQADAVLVPGTLGREVRIEGEITGLTNFAVTAAGISLDCPFPLMCGCVMRYGDMRSVSVMTFAAGFLSDISDSSDFLDPLPHSTISDIPHGSPKNIQGIKEPQQCREKQSCGVTLKVLGTEKLKMGLLVDTDVLSPANWRKLAPVCDIIIGIARKEAIIDREQIPALAAHFEAPYVLALSGGELMWGNP